MDSIKKLGFGLMRLPSKDNEIDIEQTKQMVDTFMKNGFTYFDTAYGYGDGASERAAKLALVDRYPRESFLLATKLPAWYGAKNANEAKEMFYTSLERTGAGYFDFFLLHNLGGDRTVKFDEYGIWDFLQQRKKEGLIKKIGFSFHDKADVLDSILTAHPEMEFVQLQINYADWDDSSIQSRKCYEVARRHNKPVIVMEPVKGGSLANPPKAVKDIFEAADKNASPSQWAIRFGASLDGVITVLSGMSNMEQLNDNVSFMSSFKPLTGSEQAVITAVQKAIAGIDRVKCTDCRYCMKGCPQGIVIPAIFGAVNNYLLYNNLPGAKGNYDWETRDGGKASKCIECGACESVCPQQLHIIDELKRAKELFE